MEQAGAVGLSKVPRIGGHGSRKGGGGKGFVSDGHNPSCTQAGFREGMEISLLPRL